MSVGRDHGIGLRRRAEWESHAGTLIGWPHHAADWPGKFAPIPYVFAEIVRWIVQSEWAVILVNDDDHLKKSRHVLLKSGVDLTRVQWEMILTNRGWTRDLGPIMCTRDRLPVVVDFEFNAWAKYSNWASDNAVASVIADRYGLECVVPQWPDGQSIVLEGGAIDCNGCGAMVTTEECLMDSAVQVRNSGRTKADYEWMAQTYLGVNHVIWLGEGIVGDDTHGHVDDVCRFVGPDTVVLAMTSDRSDPNYARLHDNHRRLENVVLPTGNRLTVVPLPCPEPVVFDGERLPASYANFMITNGHVLVPVFNDPADRIALDILSRLFKDRTVVGIYARDLVWGLGTIHCLTQELYCVGGTEQGVAK